MEREKGEGEKIRVADRWVPHVGEEKEKDRGACRLGCAVRGLLGLLGCGCLSVWAGELELRGIPAYVSS
jgi:hypothetical protein